MQTFRRICIQDWCVEDAEGNRQDVKRGKEYTTSKEKDGKVVVFSAFWVAVPVSIFAGEQEFTKG